MNCNLCKENLEAYLEGRLPEDMKRSMRTHLEECSECNALFTSSVLIEKMVAGEREAEPNPFLHTRIMAKIGSMQETPVKQGIFSRVLQPALITMSLAAAIFAGLEAGSLFITADTAYAVPEEMVYLDDAGLESLSLFVNE